MNHDTTDRPTSPTPEDFLTFIRKQHLKRPGRGILGATSKTGRGGRHFRKPFPRGERADISRDIMPHGEQHERAT